MTDFVRVLNYSLDVLSRIDLVGGVCALFCELGKRSDVQGEALAIDDMPVQDVKLCMIIINLSGFVALGLIRRTFTQDIASMVRRMSETG